MNKNSKNNESTRVIIASLLLLFVMIATNPSSKIGHLFAVVIIFLSAYLVYHLVFFLFKSIGKSGGNSRLVSALVATALAAGMGFSSIGQLNGLEGLLLLSAMFLFGFYMARFKK